LLVPIHLCVFSLWGCSSETPSSIDSSEEPIGNVNDRENVTKNDENTVSGTPIIAVDISSYPEISLTNTAYYTQDGNKDDFLNILQMSGVNTIRLRLWVNPSSWAFNF
jgi:arabinogalactan endo-1,4-beta-galactosidase